MRRPDTSSPPPTGPMVRMLRRIARGKRPIVLRTKPTNRGYAMILAGLLDRGLIEPGTADGGLGYRLTPAGHAAIARTRSTLR